MFRFVLRGLFLTYREIFAGLMLGISALFILIKLSPEQPVNVGLLVIFGAGAGVVKGLAKFILVEVINKVSPADYKDNYPKYKMLGLWSFFFIVGGLANYGVAINRWFSEPARFISESAVLGHPDLNLSLVLIVALFITGVISFLLDPPN